MYIMYFLSQGLQDLMESFRSAKGPVDLQQKGSLLVKKVENIREDNQRRIQDHINFLKQEIEAALAKVINIALIPMVHF